MTSSANEPAGLPPLAVYFDEGKLQATRSLGELLGFSRPDEAAVAGFEITRDGAPLEGDQLPWARAARGEPLDELERWRDPRTCRHWWFRARTVRLDGAWAIALDDQTEELRASELCELSGLVARLLLQAGDPRAATNAILQNLSEIFAAPVAALLEPRRSGRSLGVTAAVGLDADQRARLTRAGESPPALSQAMRTRAPATVEDLAAAATEAWSGWLAELGVRSLHAVPLAGFGDVAGVLLLACCAPGPLRTLERRALTSSCDAWAIRLHQERGREAERQARRGLREVTEAAFERGAKVPLRELLRLLVEQACALTNARYGALGVLALDRTGLEDFVTVGMSEEEVGRLAHRPLGKGLLGAVVHEGRTIRVADLAADPRRYGFPAGHPPMRTFLGTPLRLGRTVYGNFYLTEKEGGGEFTEDDEKLLEAFAQQAALTIAYSRETDEQRRLLDAVLRQTPHAVLFYADEHRIAFSNEAAVRTLGVEPGESLLARGFRQFAPDGRLLERSELPAIRALAGETVGDKEVRISRPGAAPQPFFASAAPVWSQTGTLLGAVLVLQDISAFKELERMREEIAAVVAHDLRNPVQSIAMQLQALRRATGPDGRAEVTPAMLDRMLRASERLELLIDDLLEVSRIEGHRVHLDRRAVQLPEAVAALLRQVEPTLGGRRAELKVEGAPPAVLADPLRLDQILTNLVVNATKYSEPGAPIELRVASAPGGASITVKDYGAGIAAEDLPRLFDRYYQAQRARVKKSGLGLGLFITKGLVDAHGGRLSVRSAPGQGSEFEVWLPAAPPDSPG